MLAKGLYILIGRLDQALHPFIAGHMKLFPSLHTLCLRANNLHFAWMFPAALYGIQTNTGLSLFSSTGADESMKRIWKIRGKHMADLIVLQGRLPGNLHRIELQPVPREPDEFKNLIERMIKAVTAMDVKGLSICITPDIGAKVQGLKEAVAAMHLEGPPVFVEPYEDFQECGEYGVFYSRWQKGAEEIALEEWQYGPPCTS